MNHVEVVFSTCAKFLDGAFIGDTVVFYCIEYFFSVLLNKIVTNIFLFYLGAKHTLTWVEEEEESFGICKVLVGSKFAKEKKLHIGMTFAIQRTGLLDDK